MNFGFSGEMIFLFFLALILFGPKKLPEIGRQIGRIMNEFRRASNEFRSQIESEMNALERDTKPNFLQPLQPPPLGSLASRILNPPPAEQIKAADEAAEARAAEGKSADATSAEHAASAPGHAVEIAPSSSPSKVAPDA
ncbi:MAG TPA: twin-arginine translocase TatA/TatE family subunit [Terriglobales bacterium]|nr:twin-arginine translocase TatA/TatE family subunit [Terriglobales bacterium]